MANPYYNATGVPVAVTRGTSSLIRAEFAAIGVAFDSIAQLIGKNNGQAWTGTQDFTGATITVPTLSYGASGAYAASIDYVNAALINAAVNLPGQTGNAGKFLKTNGTTASWAYPGIATVAATVTTSATLSGSYQHVPVQMAAQGKAVMLPDATTLTVGGPQFIIDNSKGAYPAGIRDNAGTLVMAVAPGGVAMVSLKDNSTAAGVWAINGTGLEPGLVTFDSTFSTTYLGTVFPQFLALDNNTSLHFAALSSGFAAFILDNAGKVVSTPVTVTSTASSVPCAVFKISATQAILFYGASNSSTDHKAVVLTLSGASPSLSLTVGTAASLTATTGTAPAWQEDGIGAPNIAQLSPGLYVSGYVANTGNAMVVAIAVSGSTVTIGTPVAGITNNSGTDASTIYPLTATTALLINPASATITYSAVVVSVSGTTCSIGTIADTSIPSTTSPPSSVLVSPTKCLIVANNNSAASAVALTISGTSITVGSAVTVDATVGAGQALYTASGATRFTPHLWLISAGATNLVGCWLADASNISRMYVLSETGGTITVGTKLAGGVSLGAVGAAGDGFILPQGATEAVALRAAQASTAGYGLQAVPIKISGTTMTAGYGMALRDVTQAQPNAFAFGKLASGDYALLNIGSSAAGQVRLPIFRSNGDTINLRGAISIPELVMNAVRPIPAVSAARFALLGGTVNGGTAQLRVLVLEVAA